MGLDDAKIQIKSDISLDFLLFLQKSLKILGLFEKSLSLQQIIKAPPFFLEWTWPSEDGFFFNFKFNIMAQRVTFYIDGFNFYYGLRRTKRTEPE